jgi:hypothetical protein
MTATTKTTLAVGLTVGGLLAGMGGIGLMNGPGKGSAQAAGLHSTISTISAVGHEVEMAAIAAEPVEKVAETKPQAEKEKTTPTAENTKNFGIGQQLLLAPGMVTKWDYSIRSPRVEKIEKELTALTEVDFQGVTLREAVDYFKSLHRVEILIDRKAFEDDGKTNDLQVDLQISAVSLKTALRILLEPHNLDYIIKNDNLIITTATGAENHMETRVYDVRRTGLKSPESLIKAIEGTIQGEHVKWNSKDNAGGVIQPLETALVIRQTQRVHEQIIDLLEQLERLNEAKQNQK